MKKQLIYLASLFTLSVAILTVTSSCKKDDDVVPVVTITSVTSSVVTLNNQKSASNQKYVISTKTFAANNNFDIAYGNGTAANNKFFIGGPTSESVASVYTITGATTNTEFYTSASLTSAKFDTLVNKKAIALFADGATPTASESNGASYRIKSETAWAAGSTFVIKLSSGDWVVAKVTSAPTGNSTTAGSVGLSLKW